MAVALLRRSAPPPVSPERAALAQAIASLAELDATHRGAVAAEVPAREQVWAARQTVEDAKAGVEQAKRDAALHLQAIARGIAGPPPRTIRDARNALVDAEDLLASAEQAREALAPIIADCERRRGLKEMAVAEAGRAVFVAEATKIAAETAQTAKRAYGEFLAAVARMKVFVSAGVYPTINEPGGTRGMHGLPSDDFVRRTMFAAAEGSLARDLAALPDAAAEWREAFEALKQDAAVALPVAEKG